MRPRKHVPTLAAIFLTLSFTLPVQAAEPAAAPLGADARIVTELAGRGGPIAVEGQLTGRNGKPTGGTIEAFAWPIETLESHLPDGASVDRIAVAAAQVGANGKFQLRLDSASLPPGYVSSAGQVDLELVAWNADGQTQSFTSVRSHSADGTSLWVNPTAPEDVSASQAAAHGARASLALTEARTSGPSTSEALTTETSTSAAGGVEPQLGIPVCPPSVLVSSHNVWVLIGRSMNYNSTQTSWMVDGASQSITLGVATSAQSTVGYKLSGTSSTTSGINFDWAPSSSDRRYYTQVNYGKYRFTCAGVTSYTFRPRFTTGGYTETLISYNPSWANCVTVSAGTWSRNTTQGSTTSFSGGVEAFGVISLNLSFESTYSSNRALNYRQTATRRLCGNNNVPSLAGEIEGEA
jgi:hypothetical protein